MSQIIEQHIPGAAAGIPAASSAKLRNHYLLRAIVAAGWVAAAFSIGINNPLIAAILLVAYPAWDALANLLDAAGNGGLGRNRPQLLNIVVSGATAAAVLAVIGNMNAVLGVFGAWAIFAGLLQLATGARRWRTYGAQWAMILSGAQSALAGGFFIKQSLGSAMPGIADIAPYAAFGAFYFLVSAVWLTFRPSR